MYLCGFSNPLYISGFRAKKQNAYSIKTGVQLWRPKQEIPLIGEMSRRDKRVWAKPYPEPVTPSVRNMVALLAWGASHCSLFLPAQRPPFIRRRRREGVSQLTAAAHSFTQPRHHGCVPLIRQTQSPALLGEASAFGAPNRTRTCDTAVNSRVLYRLSY